MSCAQAAQEQAAHDLEQARLQADSLLLKARSDQVRYSCSICEIPGLLAFLLDSVNMLQLATGCMLIQRV